MRLPNHFFRTPAIASLASAVAIPAQKLLGPREFLALYAAHRLALRTLCPALCSRTRHMRDLYARVSASAPWAAAARDVLIPVGIAMGWWGPILALGVVLLRAGGCGVADAVWRAQIGVTVAAWMWLGTVNRLWSWGDGEQEHSGVVGGRWMTMGQIAGAGLAVWGTPAPPGGETMIWAWNGGVAVLMWVVIWYGMVRRLVDWGDVRTALEACSAWPVWLPRSARWAFWIGLVSHVVFMGLQNHQAVEVVSGKTTNWTSVRYVNATGNALESPSTIICDKLARCQAGSTLDTSDSIQPLLEQSWIAVHQLVLLASPKNFTATYQAKRNASSLLSAIGSLPERTSVHDRESINKVHPALHRHLDRYQEVLKKLEWTENSMAPFETDLIGLIREGKVWRKDREDGHGRISCEIKEIAGCAEIALGQLRSVIAARIGE